MRDPAGKAGTPFSAADDAFDGQVVFFQRGCDFSGLTVEDARENERGSWNEGGRDEWCCGHKKLAVEIGQNDVGMEGGSPIEHAGPADIQPAELVQSGIFFGCADSGGVVVDGFDGSGSQGLGSQSKDSASTAKIGSGEIFGEPGKFIAEHAQAGCGGGMFAGAEGHTGGNQEATGATVPPGFPGLSIGKNFEFSSDGKRGPWGGDHTRPDGRGDFCGASAKVFDEVGGSAGITVGLNFECSGVWPGDESGGMWA